MAPNNSEVAMTGASWMMCANASSIFLKFLIIPVLARLLTPDDFGVVAVGMSVVLFLSYLGGRGGLPAAAIAHKKSTDLTWNTAYTANVIIGMVACLVLIFFSREISVMLGAADADLYLKVLALLIPIQFSVDTYSAKLVSDYKFKHESLVSTFSDVASGVVALILAFGGWGAWALILQYILAQTIRLIGLSLISKKTLKFEFKYIEFKKLYKFSFVTLWVEIANYVAFQAPMLIASKFIGVSASGAFSINNRLSALPGDVIQQGISKALFPIFARSNHGGDNLSASLLWSVWINSVLMVPMLLGLVAVSEPATKVILGDQYYQYWQVLGYLALSRALMAPCASFNPYLKGIGKVNLLLAIFSFRAVLVLAFGVWFSTNMGLAGLSMSIAIVSIICHFLYVYVVFSVAGIGLVQGFLVYAKPFFAALFMLFSIRTILHLIDMNDFSELVISVVAGGVIYTLLLMLIYPSFRRIRSLAGIKGFFSGLP